MSASIGEEVAKQATYGYEPVEDFRGIAVGARVSHSGERYYEAIEGGTAVVVAVMQKSPSSWEAKYGRPDIEVLVERDRPFLPGMSRLGWWADYHTRLTVTT